MAKRTPRIGLWMIGACGGVGSTVALGVAATARKLGGETGLVTARPEFSGLPLVDPGRLVIGGHEIRNATLVDAVRASHRESGLFDADLIKAAAPMLGRVQRNIRGGTLCGADDVVRKFADRDDVPPVERPAAAVERIARDLVQFRSANRLDHVVVINVASSEAAPRRSAAHSSYAQLRGQMARRANVLPPSALYALAAVEAGCSYVNFTASVGIDIPAVRQRADALGALYMGRDGKTGETLVKSALAPMFACRNLRLHSWVGHNILGNRDGLVLDAPMNKGAKLRTKSHVLGKILGYQPDSRVSIEFVRSLADWKVAWDFIHFEGFLGTKMTMQYVWHGSDSVLAAPLVIDLCRLTAHEWSRGRSGPMPHLACFFKDPMGVDQHNLADQWRMLTERVAADSRTGGQS